MNIARTRHIDEIRSYAGQKIIKVLTGIRRCGKSRLLEMVRDEILARGMPFIYDAGISGSAACTLSR